MIKGKRFFCILLFFYSGINLVLGNTIEFQVTHERHIDVDKKLARSLQVVNANFIEIPQQLKTSEQISKPKSKAVAISLAVTLGVFGVHRLYLGTANKVPIVYTLTLGGGFGFLMVSDIVAIIATKDINTFSPSEKVFMWAK